MKKIYKYSESFRRMGRLEGVFVADSDIVESMLGKEVYIGEALGKHSEVTASISTETITPISDDASIVDFFEKHLNGSCGTNPVSAYDEQEEE